MDHNPDLDWLNLPGCGQHIIYLLYPLKHFPLFSSDELFMSKVPLKEELFQVCSNVVDHKNLPFSKGVSTV